MRVAVLSDIHGNRHALEAVLDDVAGSGASDVWCLGDVVGYGADPSACCALVADSAALCLAGNHDLAVTGDLPIDEFSPGAAIAVRWTREVIEPEHLAFLGALATHGAAGAVGLFHASPRDPVWEYVTSEPQADSCLDALEQRVGLIGHSHLALSFGRERGGRARGEPRRGGAAADLDDGAWLLNPGSVGQPRDGDPRAAWLLLDTEAWRAEWRRTEYDVAGAAGAIRAARLPEGLAARLERGA